MEKKLKELLLDILYPDRKYETPPKREDFLKKALQDAKQSLDDAYQGLQTVNDPDLIDRYIYEWNAANLRFKVLLQDIRSYEPASGESSATSELPAPAEPPAASELPASAVSFPEKS